MLPDGDESLLGYVVGGRRVAGQAQGQGVNPALVLVKEQVEPVFVLLRGLCGRRFVVCHLDHGFHIKTDAPAAEKV